jgi:hypothetical protein
MAQPLLDSADAKFQERVDKHVADTVEKAVNDIVASRLTVIDRAIADIERRLSALEEKN